MVAVRVFAAPSSSAAETGENTGLAVANALAGALRDHKIGAEVIRPGGVAPSTVRFLVTGEIAASGGNLAGRVFAFGMGGRAKVSASAKLEDRRGRVLEEFHESASSGSWKGKKGTIESCAGQVGEELGAKIAKKLSVAIAKAPEPMVAPPPAVPAPAAPKTAGAQSFARAKADAAVVAPLLVGTWHSGSGTTLKFDGQGGVEESTDSSRRSGHYEILDAEQIVLTFDAEPKMAGSGSKSSTSRNSSYLVRYKIAGDDLSLIYLDAEVWKYRRQR